MAADPSAASPVPAPGEQNARRGGRLTLWGVVILVLAVSMFGGPHGADDSANPSRASGAAATRSDSQESGQGLPRATPLRLLIPKISVDAPFTALSIGTSGQLEPPPAANTNLVGWYAGGVSPGEKGTAIIAGHVDTVTSAAVFAGLDQMEQGDRFSVDRTDGRTATFVVDDTETFAKDDFPSKRVYADTSRPEVRLITCAGDYDHSVRDYTENLVVFAHLV
ncbi:class F sortase [Streptomyces sp. NPDC020362]|uniref:class F sortase n=1 Tax=unclassified Streptomyces TaxID=2593676 RepID=UPI00340B0514